jgi:hypothetical protein
MNQRQAKIRKLALLLNSSHYIKEKIQDHTKFFRKTRRPSRTTLQLHSTGLESFTKEREATSWCVQLGGPPCIYRCGTPPFGQQNSRVYLEPTLRSVVKTPRGRSKAAVLILVRPSHEFGRPGMPPTSLIFGSATVWWALTPLVDDRGEVKSVWLGCGPSNPCDVHAATRDWLRLFSLDQRVCFLHYFQLNSCIHKFLQRQVE